MVAAVWGDSRAQNPSTQRIPVVAPALTTNSTVAPSANTPAGKHLRVAGRQTDDATHRLGSRGDQQQQGEDEQETDGGDQFHGGRQKERARVDAGRSGCS